MSNKRQHPEDDPTRPSSGQRPLDDDDDSQLKFFGKAQRVQPSSGNTDDEEHDDYFNRAEFNRTTFGVQRRGQGHSGRRNDHARSGRVQHDRYRTHNTRPADRQRGDRDPQRPYQRGDEQGRHHHQPPLNPEQRNWDGRQPRDARWQDRGNRNRDHQGQPRDAGQHRGQSRPHGNENRQRTQQRDARNQHGERPRRGLDAPNTQHPTSRLGDTTQRGQQRGRHSHASNGKPRQHMERSKRMALADALVSMQWASRRIALNAVHDGRVTVNDRVVRDANTMIRVPDDNVRIDGRFMRHRYNRPVVLVMNKPYGMPGSREEGRTTIYSSLDNKRSWYTPNGVLPASVSGIILVTNDKRHRNEQASPLRNLSAEYRVKVHRKPKATELKKIAKEIEKLCGLKDPLLTVGTHSVGTRYTWLSIVTQRATIHHISKALKLVGIEPLRMDRYRLGPFTSHEVTTMSWLRLTEEEAASLVASAERGDGTDSNWHVTMPVNRPRGSAIERDGYEQVRETESARSQGGEPSEVATEESESSTE